MKVLIVICALFFVSCTEQEPIIPNSNSSATEVSAEIFNSNPTSYVIYKKLAFDGRFTREVVIDFNQTREITGFSTGHSYILRASQLDHSEEDYDFEWRIDPKADGIFISF